MGVNMMSPVNLLASVPPKVSSPFTVDAEFVGWKEAATSSESIDSGEV